MESNKFSKVFPIVYTITTAVVITIMLVIIWNQRNSLIKAQSVNGDMFTTIQTLSKKYTQLDTLCEQKYQTGIAGDLQTAYTIKGQIQQLQQEIKQIEGKYITPGTL